MKKVDIIEGNHLIAVFMGTQVKHGNGKIKKGIYRFPVGKIETWEQDKVLNQESGMGWYYEGPVEELQYHSDWNWLIPVANKISKEYLKKVTFTGHAYIYFFNIERLFRECVLYIIDYNNRKEVNG